MVLGPIETWTAATVDELVTGAWQESMVLEFKRELGTTRSDRKELAKDVSALANTSGGWIVYGLDEQPNAQGIKVAGPVVPLTDPNTAQRIDDIAAEAIVPPVRYRSRTIPYGTGSCVVLRVEPSTAALHMVQAYDDFRYYRRTERAARPMSEVEVRQAIDQIARREAEGDRAARQLFASVSPKYPRPYGWVGLSTGIVGEVLDPRSVIEATIHKYLHHEYVNNGRIEDLGYRSVLGELAYDFGVARDGSVWLKWPLESLSNDFKPFILVDHIVRLAAYADDLWNESNLHPLSPRLSVQVHTDHDLKVYDGADRYRPLTLKQSSKWLSFVVARAELRRGERLRLARVVADRVYQMLGQAQCPFFTKEGAIEKYVENEFRKLPL
jgi:hypothetical protein